VPDLDEAVTALAPRLIAYARARTGCLRTAEDVAQDALMALVRRWRLYGPPDSSEAYVFAIARRRAGRAIVRRTLTAPLDALRGIARDGPSVEQIYDHRSELKTVSTALRRLSKADREVLLLRVIGELDFGEIAILMRTSEAAVRMRLSRARRRLAAFLAEPLHGRRTNTA
jgi:RNA polymerase sigma-70 factor (ECF subfamily)